MLWPVGGALGVGLCVAREPFVEGAGGAAEQVGDGCCHAHAALADESHVLAEHVDEGFRYSCGQRRLAEFVGRRVGEGYGSADRRGDLLRDLSSGEGFG